MQSQWNERKISCRVWLFVWPENQNRIPRMFAGWDPFYSSSVDGKEKHTHPDLRWALGQSLSFATLVQGFHDNRETLWVVYNPHRNLGDAASASTVVWNFAIPFNLWGETYLSEDSSINRSTFRHVDLKSIFRNELCDEVEYQSQRNHTDPS